MQKNSWLPATSGFVFAVGILCLAETLCFTYLQLFPRLGYVNAAVYFLSGLGICFVSMWFAIKKPVNTSISISATNPFIRQAFELFCLVSFLVFISVLLYQYGSQAFAANPIDFKRADMLPLLKTACERWLNGSPVYRPVHEVWGGENIPYLPGMWAPFAPAILMHLDIRWTSLFLLVTVACIICAITRRLNAGMFWASVVFIFSSVYLIIRFYTWEDETLFELTEEAIPAFFYFILFVGLAYENDWITSLALVFCAISRFSLLPFVPFFFLWLFLSHGWRRTAKIGAVCLAGVMAFFVLPFFIWQPRFFLSIPSKYLSGSQAYWQNKHYVLMGTRNLGLAFFTSYNNRYFLSLASSILLVIVPSSWLGASVFLKNRIVHKNIWVMAGFKLTLVVFYNFISLPYLYIFLVPTIISYPLFLAIAKEVDT